MRYEEHPLFEPPADRNAIIWRYIDFTKLVSLLDSRSLFFARADMLGDEFEGSYSQANVQMRPEIYKDKIPAEHLIRMTQMTEAMRRHTYVNCWNLSDYENAALWGLYVPQQGGVAIRSTFRRLTECFIPAEEDPERPSTAHSIYVGQVRYADYERDWIPEGNTLWPFVHKRRSFGFESELRAVIQHLPTVADATAEGGQRIDLSIDSPRGLNIPVDLDVLVEDILVSPTAQTWFSDLVTGVCDRYGLDKDVIASGLADRPVY